MTENPTLHTIGHADSQTHSQNPSHPDSHASGSSGSASACGCADDGAQVPTLDARVIPHAIRHAAVFGVLEALRPGSRVDLLAPHDPLPLLKQIERRWGQEIEVAYLERGPEDFRLRFTRR